MIYYTSAGERKAIVFAQHALQRNEEKGTRQMNARRGLTFARISTIMMKLSVDAWPMHAWLARARQAACPAEGVCFPPTGGKLHMHP